jgi:hypothetical protein
MLKNLAGAFPVEIVQQIELDWRKHAEVYWVVRDELLVAVGRPASDHPGVLAIIQVDLNPVPRSEKKAASDLAANEMPMKRGYDRRERDGALGVCLHSIHAN